MKLLTLMAASGLALVLGSCGAPAEPDTLPPNLLFISIDTLRADALGADGGDWGATPFLDQFASAGIRFGSAWSHTPKTAPSHMSMFTGLPPRVHGIGNQRSSGNQELSADITTLAEALRTEGYRTGAVTSGGNVKGYLGFERGFEVYKDGPKNLPKKLGDATAWIEGVVPAGAPQERPWFFFFHTYAVHDPYLPPAKFRKRFVEPDYAGEIIGDPIRLKAAMKSDDRAPWASSHQKAAENFWARVDMEKPADLEHLHRLYMAGVASLDFQLKKFLVELESKGLLENTIVVLTSDHGEEFGEHGQTRHSQLWQELLHIPLIVHVPGDGVTDATGPFAGRVIEAAVRHMDLVPSLLDLMGLEREPLFQQEFLGTSWAAWLADPALEEPGRPVYSEHRSKLERPLDLWSLRQGGGLVIVAEEAAGEGPWAEPRYIDELADPTERVSTAGDGLPGRPAMGFALALPLLDLRAVELGRFQKAALIFGAGKGVELDEATRAELEGLGYL